MHTTRTKPEPLKACWLRPLTMSTRHLVRNTFRSVLISVSLGINLSLHHPLLISLSLERPLFISLSHDMPLSSSVSLFISLS